MKRLLGMFMVMAFAIPVVARASTPTTEEHVEKRFETIHWIDGPATASVYEGATLALPEGYRMTDAAGARKFCELSNNIYGGQQSILTSSTGSWWASFRFDPSGRVSDEEGTRLDAESILKTFQQRSILDNAERKKRGIEALTIDGWLMPPRYNAGVKRLEWTIRGHNSRGQPFANYNTRLLGRHGVVEVRLVVEPEKIIAASLELTGLLQGFSFREGNDYASWKSGDKVAAYGLTTLITGTTAAVAAKLGLLQKLGILFFKGSYVLVAAVGALFWGARKNRKRMKPSTKLPPDPSTRS